MKHYEQILRWLKKKGFEMEFYPATDGGKLIFVKREIMKKEDDPYLAVRKYYDRFVRPKLKERNDVSLNSYPPYEWMSIHFAPTDTEKQVA